MSSFTSKLVVTPLECGRRWKLEKDFDYYRTDKSETIHIPEGFITDFATIPRLFWSIIPPYQKVYGKSSILHDFLCEEVKKCQNPDYQFEVKDIKTGKKVTITQKLADDIFLESMLVYANCKKNKIKAYVIYYAVRLYDILIRRNYNAISRKSNKPI